MQFSALLVAAGRGLRAGGGTPKQYRMLAGVSVLRRAVACFLGHPGLCRLAVVINPDDRAFYDTAIAGLSEARLAPPVTGGATRAASVHRGLEALARLEPAERPVLIHDSARPFLRRPVIDGVLHALGSAEGAFPALPVVDALWATRDGHADEPRRRDGLFRAQTPQGFRLDAILEAHRRHGLAADDDVAIARAAGLSVAIAPGCEQNFKITTAADFARAEAALEASMETRTGTGFDVHKFGPGNHVMLGGLAIPHDRGFVAHSDGDVLLHALTDAVFGALAEGDIGQWFPPSDPQWKDATSDIFLDHAVTRMAARGGRLVHADCTVICERPKIGPYADTMRSRIAQIMRTQTGRVSVKATTSEKLGFTGRGEGIAAMATVTLSMPAEAA
ncbi:MAG: bifunctional 2-C-methyl-D-erythritol 4-phosphate cytidylyltransferase/2-C-methyl-D-erythritol 2,4-cyclodiphosphate synthase [Pseudomonadota bacterium]